MILEEAYPGIQTMIVDVCSLLIHHGLRRVKPGKGCAYGWGLILRATGNGMDISRSLYASRSKLLCLVIQQVIK